MTADQALPAHSSPLDRNFQPDLLDMQISGLQRVNYPNGLRNDELAATFVDSEGNTYLQPFAEHDFGASVELEVNGLTSGEVISDEDKPTAIKYPATTDLVTLPAILNASIGIEEGREDIAGVMLLTGKLLEMMKERCDFVPAKISLEALAVDRSSGSAEILAPFVVDTKRSAEAVLKSLMYDAVARSAKPQDATILEQCFTEALELLEW